MKILAFHLQNILAYASTRSIKTESIVNQLVKSPVDWQQETATVSTSDFYAVLEEIDQTLKEEILGIRLGNFLNLNALGLIYHISLQTTTVAEALFYLQNYLNATFPLVEIKTKIETEIATIELNISTKEEKLNRIILENILTIVARELTLMTDESREITKTSPHFSSDYPTDWQLGNTFSVLFKPTVLKATLKKHSHWQLDLLVPEYLKLIESLKPVASFSNQVKITSLCLAKPELPDLEAVADSFNLTPRTFQRRLGVEKITFRQIVDDLKKQISDLLIRHDRFSISDITYILGYSEPAAFIHSFKKWYGDSPEKIRKTMV